jgi:hypothetical protein
MAYHAGASSNLGSVGASYAEAAAAAGAAAAPIPPVFPPNIEAFRAYHAYGAAAASYAQAASSSTVATEANKWKVTPYTGPVRYPGEEEVARRIRLFGLLGVDLPSATPRQLRDYKYRKGAGK